ncbi:MAG: hypothetical protein ACRES9_02040 [Gammaproteobacteria bacterium]
MEAAGNIAAILGPFTGKPIEDEAGRINKRPLGYIYGFADAALRVRKLQITSEYGQLLLVQAMETFWPSKGENYLEALMLEISSGGHDVMSAMMLGRGDYIAVLNEEKVPNGLILCVLAEKNKNGELEKLQSMEQNLWKDSSAFVIHVRRRSHKRHEARVIKRLDLIVNTAKSVRGG